jgi:hypothetical protein
MREQKIALQQWWHRQDFSVGASGKGLAFDGANVWVPSGNSVKKVRASDGAVLSTFPVGNSPMTVLYDGANIWVTNQGDNTVTKLQASDGSCVNPCTFTVGTSPLGMAFDGANVWVVNHGSNNVTKLQASDGTVVGTYSVLPNTGPSFAAFDGTNIWVTNTTSNNIIRLRASDGACVSTCSFFGTQMNAPLGIIFDGASLWVASSGGGLGVHRINPLLSPANPTPPALTNTINPQVTGVGTASGLAFDGTYIWVTNNSSNLLSKMMATTFNLATSLSAVPSGSGPYGVVSDGTNVWVANADGTLSKF